jgi:serine/threonine protein kinase
LCAIHLMDCLDQQEQQLFEAALALPPKERGAYLDRACGADPQVRQRILAALCAAQETGSPTIPAPLAAKTAALSEPPQIPGEEPGHQIGRYKLLELIGEGGMGRVWAAEQTQPFRRQVALKVIKLGMDTRQVVARFEAERQALALMDHPNIAKVLDAGATATGRPFFVMEFVSGIPITTYCDRNNVAATERLELFIQVCRAVHHAHQKGIIHRDLKPSNILVAMHDGRPTPKVIDFGIAKATAGQQLTDKTLHTVIAEFLGTPAYMSPEQAEMTPISLDSRSDIYSLGVLLYELVIGTTPFDAQQLIKAGLEGIRRIIREQDPPRPSTRFSLLDPGTQTTIAKRRHTAPTNLIHLVRGDLDWIILKTLEKDRTRRYESAASLAEEVAHFLKHEPIAARPRRPLYTFQKFARRHASALASVSIITLLASGLIVSLLHRPSTLPPPNYGALEIETVPRGANAEVWLDGKRVGTTPFSAAHLSPGKHVCLLQSSAYDAFEDSVIIGVGERLRFLAPLRERSQAAPPSREATNVSTFVATVPATSVCKLLAMEGAVECCTGTTPDWFPATPGTELKPGDRIRTGKLSRALLQLFDGSSVRLYELTEVTIESPKAMDIQNGRFYFFNRETGATNGILLRTPTVNARIRG